MGWNQQNTRLYLLLQKNGAIINVHLHITVPFLKGFDALIRRKRRIICESQCKNEKDIMFIASQLWDNRNPSPSKDVRGPFCNALKTLI